MSGRARRVTRLASLATLALLVLALLVGPGEVGFADIVTVLSARAKGRPPEDAIIDALVWDIRLPRSILAGVTGAALAAAGTVTQGLFRNPMAEPGVLGVSAGAATAAVVGFALGLDHLGLWATPLLAALGASAVLAALVVLTRPHVDFATLLLSGIALGALCSALTTLVLAMGTERWDLGIKIVRWLMGSFEARSWLHLGWAMPVLLVGLALAVWLRIELDALQLGAHTAASLGVDLDRARLGCLAAVALLVGMATALTGVIAFVGLVVPHVARFWVGPMHRDLLPAATMLGAAALLAVDVASRAIPDLALPPGAITSLFGAPFFLWLLRRHASGDRR
jgi:iron complex transport system permease protein